MYGYLRAEERRDRARMMPSQCGLCAHFGTHYRLRTRWLASFDPSTLLVLLDAASEQPAPRLVVRCPLPWSLRRRPAIDPTWAGAVAVGAVQLFLVGEKLYDDREDSRGFVAAVAARVFRRDIEAADRHLRASGFPVDEVRAGLRVQGDLEQSPEADLDVLSRPTGAVLASVLGWCGGRVGLTADAIDRLEAFGAALGSTLYLVDALDDAGEDAAKGRFNPLHHIFGSLSPASVRFIHGAFEGRVRALEKAFLSLPLRRHSNLVRAATVDALAGRGRLALEDLVAGSSTRRLLMEATS